MPHENDIKRGVRHSCREQGELACGLLVRDQARKETISFALQFGTSATWRVLAIPDGEEPYIVHEYSHEEFAEIHRRGKLASRVDILDVNRWRATMVILHAKA